MISAAISMDLIKGFEDTACFRLLCVIIPALLLYYRNSIAHKKDASNEFKSVEKAHYGYFRIDRDSERIIYLQGMAEDEILALMTLYKTGFYNANQNINCTIITIIIPEFEKNYVIRGMSKNGVSTIVVIKSNTRFIT